MITTKPRNDPRVTIGRIEQLTDKRVLTKDQVRAMLQLLHPDRYRGDSPDLAARMFLFFKDYEGV